MGICACAEFAQRHLGIAQPPCVGSGGKQVGVSGNRDQLSERAAETQCAVQPHYQPPQGTRVCYQVVQCCHAPHTVHVFRLLVNLQHLSAGENNLLEIPAEIGL